MTLAVACFGAVVLIFVVAVRATAWLERQENIGECGSGGTGVARENAPVRGGNALAPVGE